MQKNLIAALSRSCGGLVIATCDANVRGHGVNDELQIWRAKHDHLVGAMSGSHAQNRLVEAGKAIRVLGVDENAGASWCSHFNFFHSSVSRPEKPQSSS